VTPNHRERAWEILLAVVLASFALNGFNLWRNWEDTSLAALVAGLVLWFFLAVLAVFLLWRGRVAGAWILVVLFGIRGATNLVLVATCARQSLLVLHPIVVRHVILGTFFVASAAWIAIAAVKGVWAMPHSGGRDPRFPRDPGT
jgi:hypothetical protein